MNKTTYLRADLKLVVYIYCIFSYYTRGGCLYLITKLKIRGTIYEFVEKNC